MSLSSILTKYNSNLNTMFVYSFESPLGNIIAAADDEFVYLNAFENAKNFEKMFHNVAKARSCKFIEKKNKILETLEEEFDDYFAGKLKKFSVPIKTLGSDFQKEVWKSLQELPYGSTMSYGDLAKVMGRETSHSRSIGSACGANAHIVVIPCHRLVASSSKGGFSSGIDKKEWLIKHEKKHMS